MKPTIITAALALVLAGLVPAVAAADPVDPDPATRLAGRTVFLDPGHQGSNHSENLSRQVDDGRGGTKDCQTTGMTTVNGVPEHTINWNVAQLVKASLESLGAQVVLSRQDDSGWGGCIDERARAANASGATVAVSIHADSGPASERGFHLIVPQLPIPDANADRAQSGAGRAVSQSVRDAYVQAGFSPATYAGVSEGLQTRADVAGPALTAVPLVFVEMGNGANAEDAAVLESAGGQLEHAIALTTGIVSYLLDTPVARADDLPAGAPARTTPGATTPAPDSSTPNASDPGAATPADFDSGNRSSTEQGTVEAGLVERAAELLMPLLGALGKDEQAITSELINLAYTLAATLFSPSR
ncbi:N-acetylmuramoyl-L-alanine amidase [Nocardia higoensis]|uniref:N-acetylmuramoyl-L-alanine amidase n=1 Tax=Nocardia higoensis TaxID=228599 RepID=UPI0002FAC867|nr:N-acetylmuramoyl-L-alanine amidase [Nocardia higoensis]